MKTPFTFAEHVNASHRVCTRVSVTRPNNDTFPTRHYAWCVFASMLRVVHLGCACFQSILYIIENRHVNQPTHPPLRVWMGAAWPGFSVDRHAPAMSAVATWPRFHVDAHAPVMGVGNAATWPGMYLDRHHTQLFYASRTRPSVCAGEPQVGVHFYNCALSDDRAVVPLLHCIAEEIGSLKIVVDKPLRVDAMLAITRGAHVHHEHLPAGATAVAVDLSQFVLQQDGISTITLALKTGAWTNPRLVSEYVRPANIIQSKKEKQVICRALAAKYTADVVSLAPGVAIDHARREQQLEEYAGRQCILSSEVHGDGRQFVLV